MSRYDRNCIQKNEEFICDCLEEYEITKYNFVICGGEEALTVTHNGRSYFVEVDSDGLIHLKSENLARNNTKKSHYNEKKRKYYTWGSLAYDLSKRHKKIPDKFVVRPKKNRKGLKFR